MDKMLFLKYNDKRNWIGLESISITNLFLDLDWNNLKIIETISGKINELSALKTSLLSGMISTYIIETFSAMFPNYISSLNNVTGFYQTNISGFSSISFDGKLLGLVNQFLPSTSNDPDFINIFNNLTGDLNIITSITINEHLAPISGNMSAILGDYVDYEDQQIILSVNGQGGNVNIIKSVVINGEINNQITEDNRLQINLSSNFYKKDLVLSRATIPSGNSDNTIVNLEMFNLIFQTSARLVANEQATFENIVDWICITNNSYKNILPTYLNLKNNILNVKVREDSIIYFFKKKD